MAYEVEGVRAGGKPKKTWRKVTEKDCQTGQLYKEDAMDRGKCRKLKMFITVIKTGCE